MNQIIRFSALPDVVADDWTPPSQFALNRREFKRWLGQNRAKFYREHRFLLDLVWPKPSVFRPRRRSRMAGK